MKKLKSQSGRSMVEMLGVLAIIGVLSVGGIAGYSLAMRRHRANQVVDTLSKYALIAYSQCSKVFADAEIASMPECMERHISSFKEAGLGDLPAGVFGIGYPGIEADAKTGDDIVIVSARFDDDKLCKAVASVAGVECVYNEDVYIRIRQN